MTTYIVGAGGIGCSLGYALLRAKQIVTFVDTNDSKLDSGNRMGVRLNNEPLLKAKFLHFDDWQPQPGDMVVLCVKCFDNAAVLDKLPNAINLVPVQNGYDTRLDARDHMLEGIASYVARCDPDHPRAWITRPGELHIGPRANGEAMPGFRFPKTPYFRVRQVADIRPIKAAKLMYNAAISPLAAAAGLDNGDLLTDAMARKLFFRILRENYEILNTLNIPLGKVGPFHPRTVSRILRTPGLPRLMARFFARTLRGTYCSMAGDIEKGRTELDNYTGHLLRIASGRVSAPCNKALYDVVSKLSQPDRGVLQVLQNRFDAIS